MSPFPCLGEVAAECEPFSLAGLQSRDGQPCHADAAAPRAEEQEGCSLWKHARDLRLPQQVWGCSPPSNQPDPCWNTHPAHCCSLSLLPSLAGFSCTVWRAAWEHLREWDVVSWTGWVNPCHFTAHPKARPSPGCHSAAPQLCWWGERLQALRSSSQASRDGRAQL